MLLTVFCGPVKVDVAQVSPWSREYFTLRWFCAPVKRAQQTYTLPLKGELALLSTARASLSSCWPSPTVPRSTTTVFEYAIAPVDGLTEYFATASAFAVVFAGCAGGVLWKATNEKNKLLKLSKPSHGSDAAALPRTGEASPAADVSPGYPGINDSV